jgi:hypothetical protein
MPEEEEKNRKKICKQLEEFISKKSINYVKYII